MVPFAFIAQQACERFIHRDLCGEAIRSPELGRQLIARLDRITLDPTFTAVSHPGPDLAVSATTLAL